MNCSPISMLFGWLSWMLKDWDCLKIYPYIQKKIVSLV